jgi:hypothetical protein
MAHLFPELKFYYASQNYEATLEHAPDGWDEGMVRWERNKTYYGMFRSFTIPLKFTTDAANYLRNDFYSMGFQAQCTLRIDKLNHTTGLYYTAFQGVFDFTTFKDEQKYVEINLVDYGLAKDLKDNESTEYKFDGLSNLFIYKVVKTYWGVIAGYNFFISVPLVNFIKRLLDEMTGGKITSGVYGFQSQLLTDIKKTVTLTNGKAIRVNASPANVTPGLYYSLGAYKTTFKDFFKSLDAIFCIGIGVEVINGKDTFILERRSYFYDQNAPIYNLGAVSDFQASVNSDYTFSQIKAGFPEKDYDDIAYGNFEFNVGVSFKAENTAVSSVYDITSKYRADGQGIKLILDNSTSSGSVVNIWDNDTYDDDIFFIHLDPLKYQEVSGTFDTAQMRGCTVRKNWDIYTLYNGYNGYMSPRRCLMNHQGFIDSAQLGLVNNSHDVNFTSGGKDQQHNETNVPPDTWWLKEYEGWPIGQVGSCSARYFKPITFEFQAPYPDNFAAIIQTKPRGRLQFSYNGATFEGYILSIEAKLAGRSSQKIKLLAHSNVNLNLLTR